MTKYNMSLIHSEAKGDYAAGVDRSVVSTKAFNDNIFTYATSVNRSFQTVGTLTNHASASSSMCPAGRILHLTGRKLYPTINPMTTFPVSGLLTTAKFLVAVYDPISMINGFIDPSSSMFAKYDQNLPNFFDNGPTANGGSVPPLGSLGGKLTLGPDFTSPSTATNVAIAAGNATCGQAIISDAGTNAIATTACNSTSKIFVTVVSGAVPSAVTAGTNTFSVIVGAASTYNWMIVN